MVIDYDRNPKLTTDQKLQSLIESIMLAMNDKADADTVSQANRSAAKSVADEIANLKEYVESTKSNVKDLAVQSSTMSVTVAANSYATPSWNIYKSGYYPLGIVGYNIAWSSGASATTINVSRAQLTSKASGSCAAAFTLHNTNTSTAATANLTVDVLWKKEN